MTELLPCPFCGGKPQASTRAGNAGATEIFAFVACYCGGYTADAYKFAKAETHEQAMVEAAEAWNRRASPWRPMSECPDDNSIFVFVLFQDESIGVVHADVAATLTDSGAIAWMPIPPMVTT